MARRTAIGVIYSGGASIVTFRDSLEQNHHDKDIRCCSRSRCCASLHPRKGTTPGGGDREKAPSHKKPQRARKSNAETVVAESSNRQGDRNRIKCQRASNSNRKPVKTEKPCSLPASPLVEAAKHHRSSEKTSGELGSCNIKSSFGAFKKVSRQISFQHKENSGAPGWVNGSENSGGRATRSALQSATDYSNSGSREDNIFGKRYSRSISVIPTPLAMSSLSKPASSSHQTPRIATIHTTTDPITVAQLIDDSSLVANPVTTIELLQHIPSGVPQSSTESSSMAYPPLNQPESSSQIMHPFPEYQANDHISSSDEIYDISDYEESSQDDQDEDDQSFYDQYRDMRMNIDYMSYEELLALGERIGTVNTALAEEALSACLKRRQYESPSSMSSGLAKGDAKCSICQEEFGSGDDLGELKCDHFYHEKCIQQWFQLKNWCPICKISLSSL